jgi:hypothetical protein
MTETKRSTAYPPAGQILLTAAEAGAVLGGYSENHIRNLIGTGKLRAVLAPGRSGRKVLKVNRAELDRYAASLERAPRRKQDGAS